ncbi:MAG: hypothetical protein ACD_81C00114G0009 [uncultured bacterium]|uniref:Uncharacterized protein n=1 Tax=Candidatus Wolfebacteria bacterium GW2011_GWE2_44_13 TaxID=1619017 RepID=A0A0G1JI16_9BACT|nr:MAG: hypothetical protein ACD_81C00114G0009 [uncultured bacterium]KKT43612.1 MAG: hypothetical protein UW32_C0001G0204 [Candidatus Wolfebacteria bacterium GW2011_GWE2_44_13]
MNLVFPTEGEVIDFFTVHTGYLDVHRISELLVTHQHANLQESEWKHIYKVLHKLKSEGYLLVQNEGGDIYSEKFSSTPDRIEKFNERKAKDKEFYTNKNKNRAGTVNFDYSNNNGIYFIGDADYLFGIKFSSASQDSIHVYNDHTTIDYIALIKNVTNFDQINFNIKYDGTSRSRSPEVGQIVLFKNKNGRYALIKIEDIKVENRGDKNDEVTFSFKILDDKYPDLIVGEERFSGNFSLSKKSKTDLDDSVVSGDKIIAMGIAQDPARESWYKISWPIFRKLPKKILVSIIFVSISIILLFVFDFNLDSVQIGPLGFAPPKEQIEEIPKNIQGEAKLIADSIVITGWEDPGDYIGYLSQISSFYQRHQDIYPAEAATYKRQLVEWQDKLQRINNSGSTIYNSDFRVLEGLVNSAQSQLRKISTIINP